jgi:hypothetical protein
MRPILIAAAVLTAATVSIQLLRRRQSVREEERS